MKRDIVPIRISPEEDRRMLEEYRESEVTGLMREKGIDEEDANRYFVVMQTARNFQSWISIAYRIPYDNFSFNLRFDWQSASVDPFHRYTYAVDEKSLDRTGWVFKEIGMTGYDEDDSIAFTARITFFLMPLGGDIRHQH